MAASAVSYEELIVDLPVKLHKIIGLKIEQSFNNHAVAYLTGILEDEEKINAIYHLTPETNIKIKVKLDEEKVIFSGSPLKVSIKHIANVYEVSIELSSYSVYLDFKLKSKSFQDINNTYERLFKEIMEEYGGSVLDRASNGAVQNASIIQYQETDWEFIKRMASHLGAKLYPETKSETPKIYIGTGSSKSYEEKNHNYTIEKSLKDYLDFQKNFGGCKEEDFISYSVQSIEDYELGDQITYQKIVFIVIEKVSELVKGILVHKYRLQKEKGVKQEKLYNAKVNGVSIEGKVLAVKDDKIKLHLAIDQEQSESAANWYTFDTNYTTEGHTGWYCMPKEGDSARLYMRTSDEAEAYAKGINRCDGEENQKVQDPKIKYYGTIHGKEMKFSPKELTFSTVQDVSYIKLSNETGIEIISNKDIAIKTEKKLEIECEMLEAESNDKIILATQSASIIVDQIVHLKG